MTIGHFTFFILLFCAHVTKYICVFILTASCESQPRRLLVSTGPGTPHSSHDRTQLLFPHVCTSIPVPFSVLSVHLFVDLAAHYINTSFARHQGHAKRLITRKHLWIRRWFLRHLIDYGQ